MKILTFVCALLLPLATLGFGWLLAKYSPKTINSVYGYRTRRSSSSQAAWDFAQQYSAKMMLRLGIVMLICSVIPCLFGMFASDDTFGLIVSAVVTLQIPAVTSVIPLTERALRRMFDENGEPKS